MSRFLLCSDVHRRMSPLFWSGYGVFKASGAHMQITGIESFAGFRARLVLAVSYCMSLSWVVFWSFWVSRIFGG